MGGARSPLWGVFGCPGSPRAPRGRARTILGGLGGAPAGGRSIIGGSRGAPFRTRVRCKSIKKRWKYVYNRHIGFPGGVPPRRQKIARRTCALTISRGGSKSRRGAKKPPPRPFSRCPKARWTSTEWVLEAASLKMYRFLQEIQCFSKIAKSLPGGVRRAFFPKIWGPGGGLGTPRGGRAVFRGGPGGPFGGPCEFRGGARGGPEAPVMTKPGYAYVFRCPAGLQETCKNQ